MELKIREVPWTQLLLSPVSTVSAAKCFIKVVRLEDSVSDETVTEGEIWFNIF